MIFHDLLPLLRNSAVNSMSFPGLDGRWLKIVIHQSK
jgi:hypothetical protein